MSKITFRADDDLVERLEALDASKSEAMRDALRAYLDGPEREEIRDAVDRPDADRAGDVVDAPDRPASDTVDDAIRERVDELVADRLDELLGGADPVRRAPLGETRDLNVNVTVDGAKTAHDDENVGEADQSSAEGDRKTRTNAEPSATAEKSCDKCGEQVDGDHVYCPNCGEKASHRVFCECGDELRSDWAFCPSCGRRTSAADVLERT